MTSPAEGHGGSSSIVSVAKNKFELIINFEFRKTPDETDRLIKAVSILHAIINFYGS